jgi:dephospho-CoA kinase
MENIVVAVVGMPGSGKSEATAIFLRNKFENVYFGDVTFDQMKKMGLEQSQANERIARMELRKDGDMAIYAKLSMPRIEEAYEKGSVLLESLYTWAEYKHIREKYGDRFFVVAIVADKAIRRKRLLTRPHRPLTAEEFETRNYSQIEELQQGGPIAIADHYIINNGSKEHLELQVQSLIDAFTMI